MLDARQDPALVLLVVGVESAHPDPEDGDQAEQERDREPRQEAAGPAGRERRFVDDDGRLEGGGHGALVILAASRGAGCPLWARS